jgi:DNA-binding transcriptional LysR family regulator
MNRLESMAVFVSVAAAGSLSAASRELRMPLPTVSRKVSELEAHLNAKLLVRSTRRLVLTDVGETYLQACKRILDEVADAERGASGEYNAPHGELALTAPVLFGRLHVLPIAAEFLKHQPRVDMRFLFADRPLNLLEEHLDLAVRIGDLPDSSMIAVKVGQVRSVVCGSPAYLKEHGTPRTAGALATHACVTFSGLSSPDTWEFRNGDAVRVRSRLLVSTAEAAIDGTIAGVGLTRVLSYQVAEAVKSGRLTILLKHLEPRPLPVHLVYVRERRITAKLRAFLDFAVPRLKMRMDRAAV